MAHPRKTPPKRARKSDLVRRIAAALDAARGHPELAELMVQAMEKLAAIASARSLVTARRKA